MGQQSQRIGEFRRKAHRLQILQRVAAVLHHIMQQSDRRTQLVLHALRHMEGMEDIGQAAFIHLIPVDFIAELHCLFG